MIAIDTNVLVRYIIQDDPKQGRVAAEIVGSALSTGETVFISLVVLCESVWVIDRAYGFTRHDQGRFVEALLSSQGFVLQQRECVERALHDFQHNTAGFADLLLGRLAEAAGATTTFSFDRKLRRSGLFQVL